MLNDGEPDAALENDWAFHFDTGRLCLDLVATVGDRTHEPFDRWRTPDDLARWCEEAGLLAAPPATSELQLHRACALREAVHDLVQSVRADRPVDAQDVSEVNAWAARQPLAPQLDAAHLCAIWIAERPLEAVLATAARDAVDLVTSPLVARIRECAEPRCSVLFVDGSRPGKRRWCSMSRCGNRAKKAAYRRRQRRTDTRPARRSSIDTPR